MKQLFDDVSLNVAKLVTKTIAPLSRWRCTCCRQVLEMLYIVSIYGFVRFADEIVDSFSWL
jgi:hypothetical protein